MKFSIIFEIISGIVIDKKLMFFVSGYIVGDFGGSVRFYFVFGLLLV